MMPSNDPASNVLAYPFAPANVTEVHLSIDGPALGELREEDAFFDHLFHLQSKRLDDQRCDPNLISTDWETRNVETNAFLQSLHENQDSDDLLNLIAGMQSRRMDDQRANLPFLPGLQERAAEEPNCSMDRSRNAQQAEMVRSRLLPFPGLLKPEKMNERTAHAQCHLESECLDMKAPQDSGTEDQQTSVSSAECVTIPDEHFFRFLWKLQARRLEEQRAHLQLMAHSHSSDKKDV
ncbi:hypothetical protein D918_08631 [Trichuris suis]|nr:hypothetical protein D918_08631 [Trichuris suis]